MNEDKLKALLEQDKNLRDAIRMEEAEGPQMPTDLNARLMQKAQRLSVKEKSKKKWWPWIAAACVAGFMMVYLTPPKDTTMGTDTNQEVAVKAEPKQAKPQQDVQQEIILPEAPVKEAPKQIAQSTPAKPKKQQTNAQGRNTSYRSGSHHNTDRTRRPHYPSREPEVHPRGDGPDEETS